MAVDKETATRLADDMATFINDWILENCNGRISAGVVISALLSHASLQIAKVPEQDRDHLFRDAVLILVSGADAAVAVSFHGVKDMPAPPSLATVKPEGTA